MPDETIWPLKAHTAAKHKLLREYLKQWYPILASREKRVGFLDTFAGPGRYADGEPGSPLVALTTLLDHQSFGSMKCEFIFGFTEPDSSRAAALRRAIAELAEERGGLPPNVHWSVDEKTFIEATTDFLTNLGQDRRLIPALALVDPFGFSGAPLQQIADFLKWPKCEVIFNFMFDHVNRFATAGNVDRHFDDLFGCTTYRDAPPSGQPRKDFLRDLYAQQLRDDAHFTYVRAFEMINDRNRTGNYLFFGTRHEKGLSCMKQAMWKVDPERGTRFAVSDEDPAQPRFDFPVEPDLAPLRARLIERFGGTSATIEEVERFVRVETDYLEKSHLKRKTLAPMQRDGKILGVEGQRVLGQFPARCTIRFA